MLKFIPELLYGVKMIRLTEANYGQYKVIKVKANILAKIRLGALGILPGAIVERRNLDEHYPCIVYVKGTQYAIGRVLASKIMVEKL